MKTATAFFRRYQLEKCRSSLDTVDTAVGLTIAVAQTFTRSFTSTSSFGISPKHVGCAGHSFSSCHKNLDPFTCRCCSVNVLAFNPLGVVSGILHRVDVSPLVRV